jgi:hypothetical protein
LTDANCGRSPADAPGTSPSGQPEAGDEVIYGRRPGADDLRWRAAATEITPAKSLERIEAKATFVFSSVALIGTILAGFGVLSGASSRLVEYRPWTEAVIGLLGGALACALIATLPSLRSRMRTQDIEAVRRYYTFNINVKGWLIRLALILFSASFAIALWLLFVTSEQAYPALGLQWIQGAGHSRVLAGQVSGENLPPGARADTRLIAVNADGAEAVVAQAMSTVGGTGKLEVDITVEQAPAAAFYRLSVSLTSLGETMSPSRSVELKA